MEVTTRDLLVEGDDITGVGRPAICASLGAVTYMHATKVKLTTLRLSQLLNVTRVSCWSSSERDRRSR